MVSSGNLLSLVFLTLGLGQNVAAGIIRPAALRPRQDPTPSAAVVAMTITTTLFYTPEVKSSTAATDSPTSTISTGSVYFTITGRATPSSGGSMISSSFSASSSVTTSSTPRSSNSVCHAVVTHSQTDGDRLSVVLRNAANVTMTDSGTTNLLITSGEKVTGTFFPGDSEVWTANHLVIFSKLAQTFDVYVNQTVSQRWPAMAFHYAADVIDDRDCTQRSGELASNSYETIECDFLC